MSGLRKLIPSAQSLFVFEAAARTLSFRAAAQELNVTQPSVSHGIRALEDHLGVSLFVRGNRGNRGVSLSGAGAILYAELKPAIGRIETARLSISAEENRYITVSVPTSVAAQWLLPQLPEFQIAHPELRIKLLTTDRNVEPDREIDLTIRRGPKGWSRKNCWHITDEGSFPRVQSEMFGIGRTLGNDCRSVATCNLA